MSVTRLLISGLLVASGLILAAFTLHGAFDGRQVQAAGAPGGAPGPALKPWSTSTVGAKGGRVAASADAPDPGLSGTQPRQTGAKPDAKAPKKKRRTEKRPAEQTQKTKQQPQQTASQWPWSWFGN